MKLRDIVEFAKTLDDKYLDTRVLVDTEGAEFTVHLAEIISIDLLKKDDAEQMGLDSMVTINLDHSVKIHRPPRPVTISHAFLLGSCSICGEPTTGEYDIEDKEAVTMTCVNCHHTDQYQSKGLQE